MKKISLLTSSLLVFSAILAGCQKGDDGNRLEALAKDELSQYSYASCKYDYNSGGSALSLAKSETQTYFGKKYNSSNLESILGAGPASIVNFAESTGVRFYQTSSFSDKGCSVLSSLPSLPSDLQDEFDGVNSKGGTLGLYLNKGTANLPSTNQRAAIIVRRDANKWVLTHEFMHHLFHDKLAETPGYSDVREDYYIAKKAVKKASREYLNGSKNTEEYYSAIKALNTSLIKVLKAYFLEEMTIETILAEKFDSGTFTDVVEGQKINGAFYIVSSRDNAKIYIETLRAENDLAKIALYKKSADFKEFEQEIAKLEKEMNELAKPAQRYKDKKESEFRRSGLYDDGQMAAMINHQGCSHSHGLEKLLEEEAD